MPVVVPKQVAIEGVRYIAEHEFSSGCHRPVFDVLTSHGLTQIVGYAKYNNRHEGEVYCRGQAGLYESLTPAVVRRPGMEASAALRSMGKIVRDVLDNDELLVNLRLNHAVANRNDAHVIVEAMLQHYGIPTSCLDVVDNHWVALWFGSNCYREHVFRGHTYALYAQRSVSPLDVIGDDEGSFWQYMLLMAAGKGGVETPTYAIDLRAELPSVLLRPHAQHGVILRRGGWRDNVNRLDYSDSVVAVLRVRVDRALRWLGDGRLVSYANLFPSAIHDHGYAGLLDSQSLFEEHGCRITDYVYDVD